MEILFFFLGEVTMSVFISFLMSWPAYMLWNGCLVDAVSIVKEVTWLQMWGIYVLFNFLIKSKIKIKKD